MVGKRRKIAGKEIFFGKKTFSTLSVEEEIGKIAFELEDLKMDKEKRREKIGDFAFF